jgi:hypothetical protein
MAVVKLTASVGVRMIAKGVGVAVAVAGRAGTAVAVKVGTGVKEGVVGAGVVSALVLANNPQPLRLRPSAQIATTCKTGRADGSRTVNASSFIGHRCLNKVKKPTP